MIERREFEMDLYDSPMLAGETPVAYAERRIGALGEGWLVTMVEYRNQREDVSYYGGPRCILFSREVIIAQAERFRKDD